MCIVKLIQNIEPVYFCPIFIVENQIARQIELPLSASNEVFWQTVKSLFPELGAVPHHELALFKGSKRGNFEALTFHNMMDLKLKLQRSKMYISSEVSVILMDGFFPGPMLERHTLLTLSVLPR